MQPNTQKIEPMSGASPFQPPSARPQIQPMQPPARPRGVLRMLATLGMPGLVFFVLLALAQIFAPPNLKPAYLLALALAQYENTVIAETKEEKAAAEELLAQARADGEKEAELKFQTQFKELEFMYQEKLVTVQTQLQSGLAAYQSLYERANFIQQAVYQMEGTILQHKQQAVRSTQGGKELVANVADVGCFFVPELCKVGDGIRDKMSDELVDAGRRGAGQVSRDYLQGIPDPAQLQAQMMLPPRATIQ